MAKGEDVGGRIRVARQQAGVSASGLARLTGVTPTAVWNWENSGITPRPATLAKVAAALNVSEISLKGASERSFAGGHESRVPATPAGPAGTIRPLRERSDNGGSGIVSAIVDDARQRIAAATGYALDRVKISIELVR
jgi:transcriptional regulator with XRE-family HTH domain